ncbi:MAG: MBOAT family protein [Nitrospinae bacterium]|nr:MBOAT family protein [Nitrospinota bacterium]
MVFQSAAFFVFFIIVYGVHFLLNAASVRSPDAVLPFKLDKFFLLAASYYFYAYWDARFLSLVIAITAIDYWAGRGIFHAREKKQKRFYLTMCLAVNLGILGFFKYCNFFVDSANYLLAGFHISASRLDIILPIGISFYTFQAMTYPLDIYLGKMKPADDPLDFALYVGFFPQIMAGPIARAASFLPQLLRPATISGENFLKGLQVFLYGLFLKAVIADNIQPIIDPIFKDPQSYDGAAAWLAVIGYSIQIFCDFSGYSEMAIGVALSLGYELPVNFRTPYLAADLSDFWRRWHISLSSWLRDYLYIPLGGNRLGFARAGLNAFITMLLGGLWHGPSWNFVFWGGLHGAGLFANRVLAVSRGGVFKPSFALTFCKWAATYLFVCFAWVPFRAGNMDVVWTLYGKMLFMDGKTPNWEILSPANLFFVPWMIVVHLWFFITREDRVFFKPGSFAFYFFIFFVLFAVFAWSAAGPKDFIYFQF